MYVSVYLPVTGSPCVLHTAACRREFRESKRCVVTRYGFERDVGMPLVRVAGFDHLPVLDTLEYYPSSCRVDDAYFLVLRVAHGGNVDRGMDM
jgi:hypothetical protein